MSDLGEALAVLIVVALSIFAMYIPLRLLCGFFELLWYWGGRGPKEDKNILMNIKKLIESRQ